MSPAAAPSPATAFWSSDHGDVALEEVVVVLAVVVVVVAAAPASAAAAAASAAALVVVRVVAHQVAEPGDRAYMPFAVVTRTA